MLGSNCRTQRLLQSPHKMSDPEKNPNKPDPNLVKIEPGTLVAIIIVLLLLPLLLTGFLSQ